MNFDQKIQGLTYGEEISLIARRDALRKLVKAQFRKNYGEFERVITIDKLIEDEEFLPNGKCDIKDLCVLLGDNFIRDGFEWVTVEGVHGKDFAVIHKNDGIIIYPRLLVAKLLDEKERVASSVILDEVRGRVHRFLNDAPEPVENCFA